MKITYTTNELNAAISKMESSIEYSRELFLRTGTQYWADDIAKQTKRIEELRAIEIVNDQITLNS